MLYCRKAAFLDYRISEIISLESKVVSLMESFRRFAEFCCETMHETVGNAF